MSVREEAEVVVEDTNINVTSESPTSVSFGKAKSNLDKTLHPWQTDSERVGALFQGKDVVGETLRGEGLKEEPPSL